MMKSKNQRSDYLYDINKCFNTQFDSMAEYKEEINFKRLLDTLTLENVLYAIENAEKIECQNLKKAKKVEYSG